MKIKRLIYNRLVRPVITVHDRPQPIALGIFIGIFIGTTPTIGLQIPLAVILAAIFRANKIAAAAMTWPANWLTAVPLYWFEHFVGAKILGKASLSFGDIRNQFVETPFGELWKVIYSDLFWPLMLGGAIVALVFAIPWYPASLWLLHSRRRRINDRMRRIMTGRRLVLASRSSRRQRLVAEWGYDFEVIEMDSRTMPGCRATPLKTALHNARRKARAAAPLAPDSVVVAAETITVHKGRIYGKPVDDEDAGRMLRELQGTKHSVITAICALDSATGRWVVDYDEVVVRTRRMSTEEIRAFVRERGLSRAGAYKVQVHRDEFIKSNDGYHDTVVGFPRYIFERMMPRLLEHPRAGALRKEA